MYTCSQKFEICRDFERILRVPAADERFIEVLIIYITMLSFFVSWRVQTFELEYGQKEDKYRILNVIIHIEIAGKQNTWRKIVQNPPNNKTSNQTVTSSKYLYNSPCRKQEQKKKLDKTISKKANSLPVHTHTQPSKREREKKKKRRNRRNRGNENEKPFQLASSVWMSSFDEPTSAPSASFLLLITVLGG